MTEPGNFNTEVGDMFAVHHALLGALDDAARLVSSADSPERVEMVASFYDNVLEFLHVHHMGEDELLYPVLEERCGHERDLLIHIDDQHKLLYEPMDQAWAALDAWRATPTKESGQGVVDAITNVDTTLRPHLHDEEERVLPIATKWISPEEWAQLPGHAMAAFRKDKPWLAFGLVHEQLPPEAQVAMIGGLPPELQQVWANEWEPAFNSFVGEVRG